MLVAVDPSFMLMSVHSQDPLHLLGAPAGSIHPAFSVRGQDEMEKGLRKQDRGTNRGTNRLPKSRKPTIMRASSYHSVDPSQQNGSRCHQRLPFFLASASEVQ